MNSRRTDDILPCRLCEITHSYRKIVSCCYEEVNSRPKFHGFVRPDENNCICIFSKELLTKGIMEFRLSLCPSGTCCVAWPPPEDPPPRKSPSTTSAAPLGERASACSPNVVSFSFIAHEIFLKIFTWSQAVQWIICSVVRERGVNFLNLHLFYFDFL